MTLPPLAPDVPCRDFRAAVDEHLDGSPTPLAAVRAAAHLRRCPPCVAWVSAQHAYRRMMRRLGAAVVAPFDLRDRIRAVLRQDARRPNA